MFKIFIRFSGNYSLLEYTSVECSTQFYFSHKPHHFYCMKFYNASSLEDTYYIEEKQLCYLIWPFYFPYLTRENSEHCVWFSFDIKILHLEYLLSTRVSFFLLTECLPSCSTTQKPFPRIPSWKKSQMKEKLPECRMKLLCSASKWKLVFSI